MGGLKEFNQIIQDQFGGEHMVWLVPCICQGYMVVDLLYLLSSANPCLG
jgi:hypothetical protein